MRKALLILGILWLALAARPAQAAYSYYRAVTVDHTKVSSGDQAGFPILVCANGAAPCDFSASGLNQSGAGAKVQNSNGYDVGFFTDTGCTSPVAAWEVEKYVASTGELIAWVNDGTLSHTSDTTFYLCYDDASISSFQSTVANVWDSHYKGVFHFPDGSSLSVADSTGLNSATNVTGVAEAGQIDGGEAGKVDGGSAAAIATNSLTVETWVNPTVSTRGDMVTRWKVGSGNSQFDLLYGLSSGKPDFYITNGSSATDSGVGSAAMSNGTWNQVVGTYDGTALSVYLNGVSQNSSSPAITLNTSTLSPYEFGDNDNGDGPCDCILDEIRISDTARSDAWIATEYSNESAPGTFEAIGTEQSVTSGSSYDESLTLAEAGGLTPASGLNATGSATLAETGALSASAPSGLSRPPALFFSDLLSGPNTGGEDNKGVFVTVYGEGFGSSQGSSTMTIDGDAVDNCPVWGADWLWYQKITCQIGPGVATGDIVVTVNGQDSNPLPFTVRSGNIYFADIVNGNDSTGDGSYANPWKTLLKLRNSMVVDGDTGYLRGGTYCGTDIDSGDGIACLFQSGDSGSSGSPRAILGYPGETATITCTPPSSQCIVLRSTSGTSGWFVFAELDLAGAFGTHYIIDWENGGGGDGIRWIGNKIHGAYAVNVVLQGNMDGSYFLGNYDYDYWSLPDGASGNERGYGLYYGGYGTQQNAQIEWNRFYNSQGTGGFVGIVNTSGTAVSWVSGDHFDSSMAAKRISIGDANYLVDSVTDGSNLVLDSSASTQSGVTYVSQRGASAKAVQIYGHILNDSFIDFTVANNQVIGGCMEGMAIGGSDDHTTPPWRSGTLKIYNNVIVNNGSCDSINALTYSGLQVGDGLGTSGQNGMTAEIANNTFYENAGGSIGGQNAGDIYLFPRYETFDLSNNIHYASNSGSAYTNFFVLDGGDGSGGAQGTVTGQKNLFYSNGNSNADASSFSWLTATVSTSDPLFNSPGTDPASFDFHLQSSSPAKSGGETLADTTPDMDGIARPQNGTYALGPYEYFFGHIYSDGLTFTQVNGLTPAAQLSAKGAATLAESAALGATGRFAAFPSLALAETGVFGAAGGFDISESLTFSKTGALALTSGFSFSPSLALAESNGLTSSDHLSAAASMTLAATHILGGSAQETAFNAAALGTAELLSAAGTVPGTTIYVAPRNRGFVAPQSNTGVAQ